MSGQETTGTMPDRHKPHQKEMASMPVVSQEYVISPDDVLDVFILDVPELSRAYRVSQSGQLTFPLLAKALDAGGKTLDEFSSLLTSELTSSGTISDPHVTVAVKESRMHTISITGAVRNPQIYPLMGRTNLLAVLSQAGGIADDAGNVVKIARGGLVKRASGPEGPAPPKSAVDDSQTITINLHELLSFRISSLNVDVYPGDWVTVPAAGVIYVVGAVNHPGGFVLNTSHERMTVLQAVALAADVKPTAQREHSLIIRRDLYKEGARQEIAINLKNILRGNSPDIALESNDILFIPDSTGKRVLRRAGEMAIQMATGLALFHP